MKWYGWTDVSVAPTIEPVTTAEAKTFCRIDHSDEDTLIGNLVKSARLYCESYTKRQLITATFTLKMNQFPGNYTRIWLQRSPCQSVGSISYEDQAGDTQTLAASKYQLDISSLFGSLIPAYGEIWPETETGKENAVTITYDSGYGDATTDVPESLRTGILMYVAYLYEARANDLQPPLAVRHLWDSEKVQEMW